MRALVASLAVAFTPANPAMAATVLVGVAVTPLEGDGYRYDVSVTNEGPGDVVLVSFTDAPAADPRIAPTLVTPRGFMASYDGGLGYLDLIEDLSPFTAGETVAGFSFETTAAPFSAFTVFESFDTDGAAMFGSSEITVIPEPSVPLLALASLACLLLRRRLPHRSPLPNPP